jgi:hypothetical protein
MLKIWSMKKEQKDAENAEGQAAGGKKKKVTAAQLRVQKGEHDGTAPPDEELTGAPM